MLFDLSPLLLQDRQKGFRATLSPHCTYDQLFKAYDERHALLEKQRVIDFYTPGVSPTDQFIQLQKKNEELNRENSNLIVDIERKEQKITNLEKIQYSLQKEIEGLQKDLKDALGENATLNNTATEQAKALKEMHTSRDRISAELEKVSIERNELLEILKNEKMRMADTLNEINELHESLRSKESLLNDETKRLDQKYKDLYQGNPSAPLAPAATDFQLSRNVNLDVPNIVARKLTKFHSAEIYDIAFNLNGSLIATCGGDRFVRVYDPLNQQPISQFQASGDEVYTSICFSPSFECLLMGSTNNTAQLWQVSGWKIKSRFVGHSEEITSVDFIGGEKEMCISGSKDRCLKVWNVNSGTCIRTVNSGSMVTTLACQHNIPFVLTAHKDGSLRGYALKSDPKPTFHQKNLFDDSITSITLSQDNNSVLLCSKEGSCVKLYDLRMNKVSKTYTDSRYMNSYDHNKVCFGPDEAYVIAGNADSTIVSWKTQQASFHKSMSQGLHEGVVLCLAYHSVSGQMFSADSRGNLVIWR